MAHQSGDPHQGVHSPGLGDSGDWGLQGCPSASRRGPGSLPGCGGTCKGWFHACTSPSTSSRKGVTPWTAEVVAQRVPPMPHVHCSLFLPPVPLDPEKVLEELKKKDRLEEVSSTLGTAQLPHGCPLRWVALETLLGA